MSQHDDDPDHCHGEALVTPEQDAAVARRALAEGDPGHALFHVAHALATVPEDPAMLALLEAVLASVDDALALTQRKDGDSYALFAARAFALRRAGRSSEAVEVLLSVLGTRPDSGYTAWLSRWIEEDEVDPEALARGVNHALRSVDRSELGARYGASLRERLLPIVEAARSEHPSAPSLAHMHTRLLRVLRRYAEALVVAEAEERRAPTYESAMMVGTVHREAGDLERGLAAFRLAADRHPSDAAIRLDIGDTLLDLARWDEAAQAYEDALAREPDDAWASASVRYARYRASGALADREALEEYARAHPNDSRAQSLVARVTPYVGHLPDPRGACLGAVLPIWTGQSQSPPVTSCSTALEPPSALASADDALRARGFAPPARSVSSLDPDPRVPLAPTAFRLWTYEDLVARPALPPPAAAVASAIAELAVQRFGIVPWCREAEPLGRRLGPSALEDVLATMVHPPPRPDGWAPWYWRQQVIVAAALVLAFVEEGWAESGRRAALHSLLFGPVDWTTTAGIVAMTELAFRGGAPREDALAWFDRLLDVPASPAIYECIDVPLVEHMLQLELPAERLAALRRRRRELIE